MRLRHIEVFHAVYSAGSVTQAAELLNVSQPSVSKVLAHAEQQLGYPLFERVKGKLVPTPEADQLFAHVREVNDSLDRMRHVAEDLRKAERGRIRIAATPAFGVDLLPGAIARFREQNRDVFFSVETLHHGEICNALLESRVDIGLLFDPGMVPGISGDVLGTGRMYVLTPPGMDFGGRETLRIEDLAGHPFISLDRRGPVGRLLQKQLQATAVELDTVAYAETYHVAKSMVAHGAGVTVADGITARSRVHENVRAWPLEPELKFRVSVVHADSAPLSLVARSFIDELGKHITAFLD